MKKSDIPAPEKFLQLRNRAGLSRKELSERMGFKSPNALFRYQSTDLYTEAYLPLKFVRKLATVLRGLGDPPITEKEIFELAGVFEGEIVAGLEEDQTPFSHAQQAEMQVPVMGIAKAGPDDELFLDDPIGYAPCPPVLCGVKDAYLMEVHGDSMKPRYRHRAVLHVNPQARPRPEDGVVVVLTKKRVLVKEWVRQSKDALYLRQTNPPMDLAPIPLNQVKAVHKVVGSEEP